jgi:hypothetical protein
LYIVARPTTASTIRLDQNITCGCIDDMSSF